jgi:hypothetical protein
MPRHIIVKTEFQLTSDQPRDRVVLNPTFRDNGITPTDFDAIALATATAFSNWIGSTNTKITSKVYDLEEEPPAYPLGTGVANPSATAQDVDLPRELALCLSFYGGQNIPRKRGRLYVPVCLFASSLTAAQRPTSTHRTKVAALAPAMADVGGADIDWIVWSRTNQSASQVTNYFVDDEWDIVRSRGLRPTARTVGTTGG